MRTSLPEPYPGIELPSFGLAPPASGDLRVRTVNITVVGESGTVVFPSVSEFMGPMRFSAMRPTLDFVFKNTEDIDTETVHWVEHRASETLDRNAPKYVEFCWKTVVLNIYDYEIVDESPCFIRRVDV